MKRKILPSALLWLFAAMFSFSGLSQSTVQIGTGTSDQRMPIEPYYEYSYSQVIYLQSEINTAGDITDLQWYFDGSSLSNSNNWIIYIGHTTKTAFSSNSDWIAVSSLTQVWSSTFADPGTSGWITFDITDFAYNNIDNLVVAVDENASGYNSTSDDFYCSSVSGYRGLEYHNRYNNPNPSSPPSGTRRNYIANIILVFGNTACPNPINQTTSNIVSTSVDLGWTENGTATTWDIEWGPAGFAQGTGTTITGVTTNPYTLSGLTANTAYDWYVRADCGGSGQSVWAGPDSFTTSLPVQTVPYTEDWETGSIGSAWNTHTGSYATLQVNTVSKHNGTYGLEQYGNDNNYIDPSNLADAYNKAQPGGSNENHTSWNLFIVDLAGATSPSLSFWYAMGYYYHNGRNNFWVQVDTGSGWIDLFATQANGAAIPYEKKIFDLSAYVGGTVDIRFFHNGRNDDHYLYLDDISVLEVTCPEPIDQTVGNIALTSVDLGWTESGTATTWDIEWGPAGFTQGTGTTITGATTNPYLLSGLSAGTAYDWYVRADCGGGYGQSCWAGPDSFSTLAPVQTLPFTEDWETGSIGTAWNHHAGIKAALHVNTVSKHDGTYGLEQYGHWSGTGYSGPASLAVAYARAQPGGANEDWTSWNSFTVDLSVASNPELSFWYSMGYSTHDNGNNFWVQVDAGSGWIDLFATQTNGSTIPYQKKVFNLTAYNGGNVHVRFFHNGRYNSNYLYLDDILVMDITCPEPTDLMEYIFPTTANLGWTENGTATTWDIEWGAPGFAQGAGTTITGVTANPYPLSGLTANTSYDWYVRADCGGGDGQSFWAGPSSFTTLVPAVNMPFAENWETGSIGTAWNHHTGSRTTLQVNTASKYNGTYGLEQYGDDYGYSLPNGLADAYVKAQPDGTNATHTSWNSFTVDLTTASAPELSFWYAMGLIHSNNLNNFWVQVDAGSGWVDLFAVQPTSSPIPYEQKFFDLSAYTGGTVHVRFFHNGSYDDNYLYLDDISVHEYTCPIPTDQTTDNIAAASVDLGWTENGTATAWDIEYGPPGYTQGTGTTIAGVTDNPYTLSGLTALTDYDWYVRTFCDPDYTAWTGSDSFTTLALTQPMPFAEDWETGSTGSIWNTYAGSIATLLVNTASKHDGTYGLEHESSGSYYSFSTPFSLADAYIKAQPGGTNAGCTSWNSFTLDLTTATSPRLSFWYALGYSDNNNNNNFWVQVDAGAGWVDLFAVQPNGSATPYEQKGLYLSAYTGGTVLIRFFHNGAYTNNYLYLDDISVVEIPCPEPTNQTTTNITSTSVDLGWAENGSATTWDIEWGPVGFVQGNGTMITGTTTNPYTLSGLSGGTDYDWYVRSFCDPDHTTWTGPDSFRTLASTQSLPFAEDWETGTIGSAWNYHAGSIATIQTNTASKHNGTYGLEQYGDGDGWTRPSSIADAYIKAQPGGVNEYWTSWNSFTVDFTAATSPGMSFWYSMRHFISYSYNYFWVQIDDGSGWVDLFSTQTNGYNIPYEKKILDLGAHAGGIVDIRFFHSGKYDDNYLYLDDIMVAEITCLEPTDQTVVNIEWTSADLGWTENGAATIWDIEYGAPGFEQGTGTIITGVTSNPYTLSGLSGGTTYDWYVRADCGGGYGQSFWAGSHTFTTITIQPMPFVEDWETGSIGSAWSTHTGSHAALYVNTSSKHNGTYGLKQYGNTNDWTTPSGLADAYIKAQPGGANEKGTSWNKFTIDLTAASAPELSFWYAMGHYWGNNENNFWAQVDAGSGWVDLFATQTNGSSIPYEQKTFDLSAYVGGTVHVRFFHSGHYDDNYLYLDDISVFEYLCPQPTDQTTTNILETSVDLGWTENGAATIWDIEWGAVGFTQGTGTAVNGVIANPYTLTGLTMGTDYDWYVRADCGGGNGQSTWAGPDPFTTFNPVQTVPFIEDWESGSIGMLWNTHAGSNATLQVNTVSKHNGTYGLRQYGNATGYTTPSGLADAYTKAQPGGTNENWTSWNSFTVDLTTATAPRLSFWYAMGYQYNNNYNNFWVQVDAGFGWVDLFATQTNGSAIPYEQKECILYAYVGGTVDIRFFHNGKYDDNYLYLDDISVLEVACPEPIDQTTSNLSSTSVDLCWTQVGTATTWDIEWGAVGFTQGTGTTITGVTANPYPLSGLAMCTAYDWYVRADCGGGNGQSNWTGPSSFTTFGPIQPMPFAEDWESGAIGTAWNTHTGSNATLQVSTASKHNGTYGLEQYGDGGNFTTPSGLADAYTKAQPGGVNENKTSWNSVAVDLTAATSPSLSFWYAMGRSYSDNYGFFWTQIDDGSGWVDLFAVQPAGSAISYEKKIFDLTAYVGGSVAIRFFHNGKYADDYLYLDDISVAEFTCPEPTDQTVGNIALTSVDLGWTENGTSAAWDIEWGAAGFVQGNGTTVLGTATNPHTLSGLSASTAYDWYVRADCGNGSSSIWTGPHNFSTTINSFPWTEDFENNGDMPYGWSQEYVDGTHNWIFHTGGYLNSNPASAHGGTYNAAFTYEGIGTKTKLVTPQFDLTGQPSPQLVFWHTQAVWSGDQDELRVYYKTSQTGSWTMIAEYTSSITGWIQETLNLPNASSTYYIAFEGLDNGGYGVCVDDVMVSCSNCPAPTGLFADNISLTSADLNWTTGGAATWNIEWGATGFAQGNGTMVTGTTTNPHPLSGLAAGTVYDFYVQDDCGGSQSLWTGPDSFTTLCGTITSFPWTEDFENNGVLPLCWSEEYVTSTQDWTFHTGGYGNDNPATAHGGTYNACFYADDYGYTTKLVTPQLDLSGQTTPQVSFWHTQAEWWGDQDYLRVYYKTSETGNWTMIAEYTSNITSWTQEVLVLPNASATYYIAFEGMYNWGHGVCVDDVRVYDNMPMIWVSSTCTQNTDYCYRVDIQQIIGIEIVTQYPLSPIEVTCFNVSMNGSTSSLNHLQDLRIYYTGNSPQFSASDQFNPDTYNPSSLPANFDVTGSQALIEGTNYFWLTINVDGNAIVGETVDAECLQISVSATTDHTPTVTAPAGSRTIHADMQWVGTVSNDWNDASNWDPANLPDATVPIIVPSGTPNSLQLNGELVINDTDGIYNCYSLDIQSGATVTNSDRFCVYGDMVVNGTYTSSDNSSNAHKVYAGGQLTIGTNGIVTVGNTANSETDLVIGHGISSGGTLDIQGGSLNVADQIYLHANANVTSNSNATIWAGKGGGGTAYSADNPATFYVEDGAVGTIDNTTIKVCGKEAGGYYSVNILSADFDFTYLSTLEICHGDYATHYDANVNIVDGADLANFIVNKPGNTVTVESNLNISGNLELRPNSVLVVETGNTISIGQD